MKKYLALLLALVMVFALAACGGETAKPETETAQTETAADPNTLTVYAWDANFNIPALKAAEAAYQKKNPDFKLEIVQQSGSSDVENAVTLAAQANDLSTLPDIVLFQDHYIQRYVRDYPS